MAEQSHISWTDATFNPWWGCTKVSAACDNCYAERDSKRYGFSIWGKDSERRFFGEKHWNEPLKWEKKANERGEPFFVFCASMSDVFEDRRDLDDARARLWNLIEETPHLRWLLLTKRPHLMNRLTPDSWNEEWPDNAYAGTTVEDQTWADARLPWLLKVPSVVRFISAEPLVSDLELEKYIDGLQWVITGGESGGGARPCNPIWFLRLRDICYQHGVPFHFKQWGEFDQYQQRVGRKAAGRALQGEIYDARPKQEPSLPLEVGE